MSPEYDLVGTENPKVFPVEEICTLVSEAKKTGNRVGLITGCFDVIHIGHIQFFHEARKYADLLVVGLDRDETVRLKGPDRPVNNLRARCEVLAEFQCVNLVFPLPFILYEYTASVENISFHRNLTEKIDPSLLITDKLADIFWKEKEQRARELGISFVGLAMERPTSSSEIIEKIRRL